jgi:hypothetical protein
MVMGTTYSLQPAGGSGQQPRSTEVLRMHCRDLASPKKCDFNGIRMATRRFRDLQVWQRSMGLAREAYKMTSTFPGDANSEGSG